MRSPPAAVGPLAAPEFAVGRGLGFAERNRLVHGRPDAGKRTMDVRPQAEPAEIGLMRDIAQRTLAVFANDERM